MMAALAVVASASLVIAALPLPRTLSVADGGEAVSVAVAPPAPRPRALSVAFLADSAQAPSLVLAIDNAGTRRSLAWALLPPPEPVATEPGAMPRSGSLVDQAGAPALLLLPHAPRGASVVERDGALSITIDDAGAWEESLLPLEPSKGAAKLPVSGPRAFRLVVHGGVDGGPVSAVLYGTNVRIAGTAIASSSQAEQGALRAVVATTAPSSNKAPQFWEAPATAVDRVAGCGGEVPSAVSVVTTSLALKLFVRGPPACAGDLAVIPVEGMKLDAKKDIAVRGVVIRRR